MRSGCLGIERGYCPSVKVWATIFLRPCESCKSVMVNWKADNCFINFKLPSKKNTQTQKERTDLQCRILPYAARKMTTESHSSVAGFLQKHPKDKQNSRNLICSSFISSERSSSVA